MGDCADCIRGISIICGVGSMVLISSGNPLPCNVCEVATYAAVGAVDVTELGTTGVALVATDAAAPGVATRLGSVCPLAGPGYKTYPGTRLGGPCWYNACGVG
mmetsp:Transcript_27936/g.64976  ORF Transcript_27936/g.64976 Transcript_27936/m.64976 type:complete len:103 (-) Transcript_27936:132-440(-)